MKALIETLSRLVSNPSSNRKVKLCNCFDAVIRCIAKQARVTPRERRDHASARRHVWSVPRRRCNTFRGTRFTLQKEASSRFRGGYESDSDEGTTNAKAGTSWIVTEPVVQPISGVRKARCRLSTRQHISDRSKEGVSTTQTSQAGRT